MEAVAIKEAVNAHRSSSTAMLQVLCTQTSTAGLLETHKSLLLLLV